VPGAVLVPEQGTCAAYGAGGAACGIVGYDSALYLQSYNGSGWLAPTKLSETLIGNPTCTSLSDNKVLCVAAGVDNTVYSTVGP
jgi:hypothetical protein